MCAVALRPRGELRVLSEAMLLMRTAGCVPARALCCLCGVCREYTLFPAPCLNLTATLHVFVIMLREPLARITSLFYYNGPPNWAMRRRFASPEEKEAARKWQMERTWQDGVWLSWINKGRLHLARANATDAKEKQMLRLGLWYHEHYYVRSLTAWEPASCLRKPGVVCGTNSRQRHGEREDRPSIGCGFGVGSVKPVDEYQYAVALHVLRNFDLVIAVERLFEPATLGRIEQALGLRLDGSEHERSRNSSRSVGPSDRVRRILEAENTYDLRLYRDVLEWG